MTHDEILAQTAREVLTAREKYFPGETLKPYIVVYPAVGLHSDHDTRASAEEAADKYRRFANPSNTYGGPVGVVHWPSI